MKKVLAVLLLILILAFSLVGCSKCIGTEISTVQVRITES